MNDEKAIETLKTYLEYPEMDSIEIMKEAIKIVLNLIEKQKAEIEKKDKIIDLMAEQLVEAHEWFYSEFDNYTKEDFIEYFENKVKESK